MNRIKSLTALSAALILGSGVSLAIPAKKGILTMTQPDGTTIEIMKSGDEHLHFTTTPDGILLQEDEDGFYRIASIAEDGGFVSTGLLPTQANLNTKGIRLADLDTKALKTKRMGKKRAPQSGMGMTEASYPTKGKTKGLIILVEYTDVKFTQKQGYDAENYFNDMINGANFTQFGGTGSALKYFTDQSGGLFTPEFDVLGPVTLPHNQKYYGGNDRYGDDLNPHLMVVDAIKKLDAYHDFSVYDTDGDGLIDNVYVFYAGQGEADYGKADTVWPHSWDVRYGGQNVVVDGVMIAHYACSNEWELNQPCGVGTFIHEFSHVMGLPDLYHTTDANALYTPGDYSVLDYGPYNNDGRTPPNYGAYEKNALGWYEPIMLDSPQSVTLQEISTGQFGLMPTSKDTEFFLFENRQQTGWDKYIPYHGMLVWHIDYVPGVFERNEVNNTQNHQYVDIVEANKKANYVYNAKGFPFPGTSNVTSFTADTNPALKDWAGNAIDHPVTNITESGGLIKFDVSGGAPEEAGIDAPAEDVVPEYFNLHGIRVYNPAPGTMVIERKGGNVKKVII